MVDYTKLAATAQRLIEANGRAVDIFKMNRDPDNASEPWRGQSSTPGAGSGGLTVTGVTVAFVPATGSGMGKLIEDTGGSLSVAFDQVGLLASDSLAGAGATPDDIEEADTVRDGTDIWKIVTRGHLKPASTSLMFVLGLKR